MSVETQKENNQDVSDAAPIVVDAAVDDQEEDNSNSQMNPEQLFRKIIKKKSLLYSEKDNSERN